MNQRTLLKAQTEKKLATFAEASQVQIPRRGWIYTIRKTIGMSLRQLGARMELTPQSVRDYEERERQGAITIKSMTELGRQMNMKFVYGYVPIEGTLDDVIMKRAMEKATEIVNRTHQSMRLEDQEVSEARRQEAILQRAEEIKRQMPRYLWD